MRYTVGVTQYNNITTLTSRNMLNIRSALDLSSVTNEPTYIIYF